jgi:DNA-binding PadR family transcriptional regulator
MSGYELRQIVRQSIGHMWSESYGQIYPNLKKLAAEGLIAGRTEKHEGKPDKHTYSITAKGRERLKQWLALPPQPEVPRNELLLKIFFGAQTSPQTLIGYIEQMLKEQRALFENFRRVERDEIGKNSQYPDAPFWKISARFGQLEMEAHVRWAEETLSELRKMERRKPGAKSRKEKADAGK